MRTCSKCGAPVRDEDRFCMKCFSYVPFEEKQAQAIQPLQIEETPHEIVAKSGIVANAEEYRSKHTSNLHGGPLGQKKENSQ